MGKKAINKLTLKFDSIKFSPISVFLVCFFIRILSIKKIQIYKTFKIKSKNKHKS